MVITYSKSKDQPGKVANPARDHSALYCIFEKAKAKAEAEAGTGGGGGARREQSKSTQGTHIPYPTSF